MAKKSFILYNDQKEVIDELNDEDAGKLFKAIYEYNVNKNIILTGALKVIFIPFKNSFDRDDDKWENIVKLRSEAGKKHSGNQYTNEKNGTSVPFVPKNGTSVPKMEQNGTNGTVSVSVSVNDSVSVSDSVSVINIEPPTDTHTIFDYCFESFKKYDQKSLEKSCKKFYNYYNEKNWKGINNWQEKLKMWIEDDIDNGKIKDNNEYIGEDGFKYVNGRRLL